MPPGRAHLVSFSTRCVHFWPKTITPGNYYRHVCTMDGLRKKKTDPSGPVFVFDSNRSIRTDKLLRHTTVRR